MARLSIIALLTTATAYVTTPPAKLTPGRTSKRSQVVLGPQSVPQVPYSPPGAEQGQHMYVDIYQALYRDRIMLVGNFLDEEQANSLIACDLGVPRCCGAFTPSTRLVSIRRGRGSVETAMPRAGLRLPL